MKLIQSALFTLRGRIVCVLLSAIVPCIVDVPVLHAEESQVTAAPLIHIDHALAESIWDIHAQENISKSSLIERLAGADYILLGETHDNVRHHEIQRWVIEQMTALACCVSVAFEMIDSQQGDAIENRHFTTAAELIKELNQYGTGWDYEPYYQELFDSIIRAGLSIRAANIDRQTLMAVTRHGQTRLDKSVKSVMEHSPLTVRQQTAMTQEIIASHCDMLNEEMAVPMVLGQRIRDAAMTLSLISGPPGQKVLIAGSGHVRKDRGVPMYLRQQDSRSRVVSIGLLEVEEGRQSVRDYAEPWGTEILPFDYVWFTAQAQRQDPCTEVNNHFKHRRE